MKRPTSVSVISWIFIVMGGGAFLTSGIMLSTSIGKMALAISHLPLWVEIIELLLIFATYVISGIFMLKGENWGRLLYIVLGAVNIIFGLITTHIIISFIESIIVYGIFMFFLTRPKVNQFFKGKMVANEQEA